ncbi:MAG: hypothetical protein JWR11_1607, partial [Mycobacterium sp.]|nr:hypothetical protein [Mycobacterium sp.]
ATAVVEVATAVVVAVEAAPTAS